MWESKIDRLCAMWACLHVYFLGEGVRQQTEVVWMGKHNIIYQRASLNCIFSMPILGAIRPVQLVTG